LEGATAKSLTVLKELTPGYIDMGAQNIVYHITADEAIAPGARHGVT